MIKRLRASGDNYSYVIHSDEGGEAVLVDPVAVNAVSDYLNTKTLTPRYIINTHGHGDHTGGNSRFSGKDTQILCHKNEASRMSGVDRTLHDGESVSLNEITIKILHTPGHTDGSICLLVKDTLISGDTVFVAGCGNPKFGGDTRDLFESFKNKIKPLDDEIRLFPGHDYAEKNLRFTLKQDPENTEANQKLEEVRNSDSEPTTTIGGEKSFNLFLRYDDPELRKTLSLSPDASDWDVFRTLRELRNKW